MLWCIIYMYIYNFVYIYIHKILYCRILIVTPNWLVVWNMNYIFHFIYGMSSFPLTFIFFRGVETTNQYFILCMYIYIYNKVLYYCFLLFNPYDND